MKKNFSRFAGVIFILALFTSSACAAGYRFDDLYGPSGISYQWMVVNGSGTFGARHQTAAAISTDLILSEYGIVDVVNGTPDAATLSDRSLSTLFFVLSDGYGEFSMDIHSPRVPGEAVANDIQFGSGTNESNASYINTVTPNGPVSRDGYDFQWSSYTFKLTRQTGSSNRYDSVRQFFQYYQDPSDTSAQGINKPVVIANVINGTATEEALELRMTLRDAPGTNGSIVAYRHDKWDAQDSKSTESENWVFVPVEDLNADNSGINYYLTTEVVNHTAVRYGAQDYSSNLQYPDYWKFDIPRYQGLTDVESRFFLDNQSQIPPGLVSVFTRTYKMDEKNIRPLRIQGVGDNKGNGMWDLVLNHNILFVKKVSEPYDYTVSGLNRIKVTAFEPNTTSFDFYKNMAAITGSTKTITPASSFQSSAITRNLPTAEAIEYFTINHSIPSNLRSDTNEILMPLLITINIPVTQIQDKTWWNQLVDEYRKEGHIENTFANNMNIYLMAENNNILNMTEELNRIGAYSSQVKIFVDEERGRATVDNDKGVITISFVIFLMNGTRDGTRPELSIVRDTSRSYIAVRDGTEDNNLDMQIFIAPSDYYHNPAVTPNTTPTTPTENAGGGGGGGGCNAGFSILSAMTILFALNYYKYKKGRNF